MDDSQEGYLLIGTTMLVLLVFLVALFLFMLVYRKRKLEHTKEVEAMKEKYHKEMLETQVEIQKDTMQQIGREIHDNVGQKLTLAVLYAEHLNLEVSNVLSSEKISSIAGLINESLSDLRELSQNLSRTSESGAGLDFLLEKEVTKLKKAGVCSVHFTSTGKQVELSLKINNMILRIAQEFFHNSIRHATCKNIYVHIIYDAIGLKMNLADDGKGFDSGSTYTKGGIGLDNMKKRASLIGAELLLKSLPGMGTKLDLFMPTKNII